MFSAPEQRRDWAQRGLLGAVPTQRNTVHFQGYPGLLWCNFPGETHSIENWDLVPTALPQHHVGMGMRSLLKSSCRGKASLKPNSVICNHLSKPLGFFFFCRIFLCSATCLYVAACSAGYAVSRARSCLVQLSVAHLPTGCES